MKTLYQGIMSAFTAAVLLSLCLTPTAYATEEPPGSGDTSIESAIETELAEESPKPSTATPSDAQEEEMLQPDHSDNDEYSSEPTKSAATSEPPDEGTAAEPITATPSEAVELMLQEPDTASTAEELLEWLSDHEDSGGTVWLSDDISLCDVSYVHGLRKPAITINTGEFSITTDGSVELLAGSPFTICGIGGENGVLRVSEGSTAYILGLALESEEGYAAFQEEESGFMTENSSVVGDIHYADRPFIWEWETGRTVVGLGETFDAGWLPDVILARVNHLGRTTDEYEAVPVTWDLSGHEEDQMLRRRFTVSGEFENMASLAAPECTVIYDDFPLTFLEVNVYKIEGRYGDSYRFTGEFSVPENRLPITIAQEYSFDGENWFLDQESMDTIVKNTFSISPFVKKEDRESCPKIFIRLSWNDNGTVYYSNVLSFATDSLAANEEPGGNRGGGTDIIDPPKQPEPDVEPETPPPPVTSEPETAPPITVPEPTSSPGAAPELMPPDETVVSSAVVGEEPKSPSTAAESSSSREPSAPESKPPESTGQISAVKDEMPENAEVLAEPETETSLPGPGTLPVVAGLAAVAVSIGGAALYLYPKAYQKGHPVTHALRAGCTLCVKIWKRLLGELRNHIRR